MDLGRASGSRGLSAALNNMALLEVDDGDLARDRDLFEQALVIGGSSATAHRWRSAWPTWGTC